MIDWDNTSGRDEAPGEPEELPLSRHQRRIAKAMKDRRQRKGQRAWTRSQIEQANGIPPMKRED